MRIELPSVTKSQDTQAHRYPLQIGLQTMEFMQGAFLHTVFLDVATSQRKRLPNGLAEVEKELVENGLDPKTNAGKWTILDKYQPIFSKFVYQNVLISLSSHWDWYIDKLEDWHQNPIKMINGTSLKVAKHFYYASDYPASCGSAGL